MIVARKFDEDYNGITTMNGKRMESGGAKARPGYLYSPSCKRK